MHLPVSSSVEEQEDAEFKSRKQTWEKAKFRLRSLEGHSDITTCVVAVDNLVISGSRDTTVKVWHVPTATEQCNLGGHSGGVTCLSAPPPEYCRRLAHAFDLADRERFVLSGSTDCCVRIWALSSGQCVKSIYTFNAVSSLCFIPEGEGFIVTGSDAGKLQVWSWRSQENCQSVNAHLDTVTTLQSQGPLLFSGSTEGCVCVWEVSDEGPEPLHRLHIWGPEVTGCSGDDGRLILSPHGDRVFLSCRKASIQILNWTTVDERYYDAPNDACWLSPIIGDVTVRRDSRLEDCLLESDTDSDDEQSEVDDDEVSIPQDASETEEPTSSSWLRCVLQ
ncbi:uncharacterized protein LOC132103489 [Carassius carassius]|uniref:uncharacterized protein LOC132103489 n=1 Tax=Carassius carassius TaxID=217509 RepID=UPI002868BE8B|nr:uncharacterized protein LOC132103489 [Carassius carassius]